MDLSALTAISPLDGRYAAQTDAWRDLFSEFALIKLRVAIELKWLQALAEAPQITELGQFGAAERRKLDAIADEFTPDDAAAIKSIERRLNHDVKAVEVFLAERCAGDPALAGAAPFLHFACTSEDINNLAYALMLEAARTRLAEGPMQRLIDALRALAHAHADLPMLARTHGQPASPTTLGKEFAVFADRLRRRRERLLACPILGKMNGAVGNYNAHRAAYPEVDWPALAHRFVTALGLECNPMTTQIEPHDYMAELFAAVSAFNTVLIDFCRDLWSYIAIGYFRQAAREGEVGSSTMPHKVNPIDFENAEGNLGVANALLNHFAAKLPISRWQRDLSDSTTLRNIGVAIAHTALALESCLRGLARLEVDAQALRRDLDGAWEVLAEPVQTVMRRYGITDSYEQLKALTRGRTIDRASLHAFINGLALPAQERERLCALTPADYIGEAPGLARSV
jgi:adenylosuccinate lyase